MARSKLKKLVDPTITFSNPKFEYIYSVEPITIEQLAKKWKGVKRGYSAGRLRNVCWKERWPELRKDYQKKFESRVASQLAEQEADKQRIAVEKAREFHFKSGGILLGQGLLALQEKKQATFKCKACGEENTVRAPIKDLMKPSDIKGFVKEGVDIQRKGLGINEAIVIKLEIKEVVMEVIKIIQKHVIDVPTYSAIRRDLMDLQKVADDEVDGIIKSRYVVPEE